MNTEEKGVLYLFWCVIFFNAKVIEMRHNMKTEFCIYSSLQIRAFVVCQNIFWVLIFSMSFFKDVLGKTIVPMEHRLSVTASLSPPLILHVISNINIMILDLLIMTFQAATIASTMCDFMLFLDIFIRVDELQIIIFPHDERIHFSYFRKRALSMNKASQACSECRFKRRY